MLNVEEAVIAHLRSLGFDARADVPAKRPDSFVTVERVGGASTENVLDRAVLAVQCWAPTRLAASQLAIAVDVAMRGVTATDGVCEYARQSMYNFPDPDSRQARYQLTCEVVALREE